MKMTRDDLRSLVREVVVEVLQEAFSGARQGIKEAHTETRPSRSQGSSMTTPSSARPRAQGGGGDGDNGRRSSNDDSLVRLAVNASTNPVLAEILSDTARTTFRQQPMDDHPRAQTDGSGEFGDNGAQATGDPYADAIANVDPLTMFGEAAKNWGDIPL